MPPKKKTGSSSEKKELVKASADASNANVVDDFAKELVKDTDSDNDAVVINEEPKPQDFARKELPTSQPSTD